ncbi:Carboxylic ester hydrolase [Aphelenchoides fujianensis]|nr:Carboxylic ester hydrolase [Aphelenchoides fujianensis]
MGRRRWTPSSASRTLRAPIGELRFKKPEPAESWSGVRDCTRFGPRCPHLDVSIEKLTVFHPKSENCLSLNVFSPHNDTGELLPVAVFVHGGGYAVHSAAHYGDHGVCKILCTKGVVVVTIQYRLGFFGFLTTGDEHAPGNYGLWDQTAALRWVQENIVHFGGDRNNVTLFGQSAGGASTDLLNLSPHSNGLFHRMMPMSGSGLCAFATNYAENIRELSLHYACRHGYTPPMSKDRSEQNRALVDFFRKLPASSLELSMMGRQGVNEGGSIDLTPVYDGDFFPKPFDQLRREAPPKPMMTGITEFEGLLFTALKPPRGSFREEVRRQIMIEFGKRRVHEHTRELHALDLYLEGIKREDRKAYLAACLCLISEMCIANGVWECAVQHAQKGAPVYLYQFDYCNPCGFGLAGILFPFKGATHCSDLPSSPSLFVNFVKFGDPNGPSGSTQTWEPLDPADPFRYFRIDLAACEMRDNYCGRRPLKWRSILEACSCDQLVCTMNQTILEPLDAAAEAESEGSNIANNNNDEIPHIAKKDPLHLANSTHPVFGQNISL